MATRKNQHVGFDLAHTTQGVIGSISDLARRLALRTSVTEQLPVRTLQTNLRRPEAFVLAVVPFDKIPIDFGYAPEPGQRASARGAQQGARDNLRESQPGQALSEPTGILFAQLREGQVAQPG